MKYLSLTAEVLLVPLFLLLIVVGAVYDGLSWISAKVAI